MSMRADVTVRLTRSPRYKGIVLTVRTCPAIEEFFQQLSGGATVEINEYCTQMGWENTWQPLNPDVSLLVYGGDKKSYNALQNDFRYSLQYLGQNMNLSAVTNGQLETNISFLRIAGISSDQGVQFLLKKTVMGEPEMQRLRDALLRNIKHLYVNFIKSVEVVGEILPKPQEMGVV